MLTAKQEKFCQEIVAGKSQSEAYRNSYDAEKSSYNTVVEEASHMRADPKIATRIEELQAPVVKEIRFGLQEALTEAEEARLVGKACDEGGVMVQATTLKSKLTGLLVEKTVAPVGPLEAAATLALITMLQECERRITTKPVETLEHHPSERP